MKLLIVTALVLFSTSQADAFCKGSIELSAKEFVASDEAQSDTDDVADKIEFISKTVANKSLKLMWQRAAGNRKSKTCIYSDASLGLEVRVVSKTNTLKITATKFYDLYISPDGDDQVLKNNVQFGGEAILSSHGSASLGDVAVVSRYHYYSTCGWADCTGQNDSKTTLGTLKQVEVK